MGHTKFLVKVDLLCVIPYILVKTSDQHVEYQLWIKKVAESNMNTHIDFIGKTGNVTYVDFPPEYEYLV